MNEQFFSQLGPKPAVEMEWGCAGACAGDRDGARMEEDAPPGMFSEAVGAP